MRSIMMGGLLLALALGATTQAQAQDWDDYSWTESAYEYAEQAYDSYDTGSSIADDLSQGDIFSATAQGVISTWRSFNQTYTPPVVREWVDRAWQEDQDELDRQRDERDSGGPGAYGAW